MLLFMVLFRKIYALYCGYKQDRRNADFCAQKYTCSKCINFSCLLNRVPKEVVDEYLKRNPIMRKAWKENGWQIGGTTKTFDVHL